MKILLLIRSVFAVLILSAIVPTVLAQPAINIAPAGNQSVLYYSYSPTNYILQSATNLTTPNWIPEVDAMSVTALTVSNNLSARFFRLIYTNPPAGMVLIPAGFFTMGNLIGDGDITDANPTNIYVSGFYMDTNLVSYGLWTNVYAYAGSNAYSFGHGGLGKNSLTNQPVQTVDWFDCVKWCNARSQRAGLTPAYYTDAGLTQIYKSGETAPYINKMANGFRLPTEAEWEKAARSGMNGLRFPWGDRIDENEANYFGATNSSKYDLGPNGDNAIGSVGGTSPATSPVGSFDVNGYGLYDMAGNVNEWCWDWYGTPYGQPSTSNPTGPSNGSYRVVRGGDWEDNAYFARCACRDDNVPNGIYGVANNIGFRCVRGF